MGNSFPTSGETITERLDNLDTQVETLRSNFSASSPPDVQADGMRYYDTTNKIDYFRKNGEWFPANTILENKLFYKNLIITNNVTANILDISADFISCNGYFKKPLATLTLDFTGTGAGKLDTGTRTANTWYFIYLIVDLGTTNPGVTPTFNVLASLNSTTPTIPAPYDYAIRIGAIRTNASNNIRTIQQSDNIITYIDYSSDTDCKILAGGSATTFTAPVNGSINMSYSVPNDGTNFLARQVNVASELSTNGTTALGTGTTFLVPSYSTLTTSGGIKVNSFDNLGGTAGENCANLSIVNVPINKTIATNGGIKYRVAGTANALALDLYVVGYIDTI